jgi:hypothetical protein
MATKAIETHEGVEGGGPSDEQQQGVNAILTSEE